MAKLFSQRYGYTSLDEVVIREDMPEAIQNAICNRYEKFISNTNTNKYCFNLGKDLNKFIWINFLNKREREFDVPYGHYPEVFIDFITNNDNIWYKKVDILEYTLLLLQGIVKKYGVFAKEVKQFENELNVDFERLNYAYRIVEHNVVEITSKDEIDSVEQAIIDSDETIKTHLVKAIELCAKRPIGDYGNSIKESISAVEAWCRQYTGESTLGKALNKLKGENKVMHPKLRTALEYMYTYTNQGDTGIRHALMDEDGIYTPSMDEAVFMMVTCSAFINYLNSKNTQE